MVFRIISLAALAATAWGLGLHRYRKNQMDDSFAAWMMGSVRRLLRTRLVSGPRHWFRQHLLEPNPARQRWIFVGILLSFLYLAASGLGFAIFLPLRLTGIFLTAHVGLGGLFAVCLAAVIFIRGRFYVFRDQPFHGEPPHRPPPSLFSRILFWIFAASGLMLILTALLMMLPLFAQPGLALALDLHRYSALAAVLSSLTFAVLNLDPPGGSV